MFQLRAINPHIMLPEAIDQICLYGQKRESRAGTVFELPGPALATIKNPTDRVILHPDRDANPFFHLFESLWMLAGSKDLEWLSYFNRRMVQFSEDGGYTQPGAYGYRWRNHFGFDQLSTVISLLRNNPNSRRAVLQMWDCHTDLEGKETKPDVCCNTNVYFLIRGDILDMTVCNRSNDLVWGMLGANCVHMSMLHEYVATLTNCHVGTYYQFTNNLHAYEGILEQLIELRSKAHSPFRSEASMDPYQNRSDMGAHPLINDPLRIDTDLENFLKHLDNCVYYNSFFHNVAVPMYKAYNIWREYDGEDRHERALSMLWSAPKSDFRSAGIEWLQRRWQQYQQTKDANTA